MTATSFLAERNLSITAQGVATHAAHTSVAARAGTPRRRGGGLTFGTARAVGNLTLRSSGLATLSTASSPTWGLKAQSAGGLHFTSLSSTGVVFSVDGMPVGANAGLSIAGGAITNRSTIATTATSVLVGPSVSVGALSATTGGVTVHCGTASLTTGAVTAASSVSLESGGALRAGAITSSSGGSVQVKSLASSVALTTVSARTAVTASAGSSLALTSFTVTAGGAGRRGRCGCSIGRRWRFDHAADCPHRQSGDHGKRAIDHLIHVIAAKGQLAASTCAGAQTVLLGN